MQDKVTIEQAQQNRYYMNLFVEQNLGLVTKVLLMMQISQEMWEDMFQVGSFWLFKCAKKFDMSLGFEFSTYALSQIPGRISREMYLYHPGIQVSSRYYEVIRDANKDIDVETIAKKLRTNTNVITDIIKTNEAPIYFDDDYNFHSNIADPMQMHDIIGDKKSEFADKVVFDIAVPQVLEMIPTAYNKRKMVVLKLKGLDVRAIGKIVKCSHQNVDATLKRLRPRLREIFKDLLYTA